MAFYGCLFFCLHNLFFWMLDWETRKKNIVDAYQRRKLSLLRNSVSVRGLFSFSPVPLYHWNFKTNKPTCSYYPKPKDLRTLIGWSTCLSDIVMLLVLTSYSDTFECLSVSSMDHWRYREASDFGYNCWSFRHLYGNRPSPLLASPDVDSCHLTCNNSNLRVLIAPAAFELFPLPSERDSNFFSSGFISEFRVDLDWRSADNSTFLIEPCRETLSQRLLGTL